MNRLAVFFLLMFSLANVSFAQNGSATRDQIYAVLAGSWTGQLEYRDFQSEQRVVLPTWLEVKSAADGSSLEFSYTYDDGPTKTVTELSTITIDSAAHSFTITSNRDHSADSYQIEDLSSGKRGIQFTLTGHGQENHKPVDVRIHLAIDRNLYRFTKETRAGGADFAFRDGYIFTRRNPVQDSK